MLMGMLQPTPKQILFLWWLHGASAAVLRAHAPETNLNAGRDLSLQTRASVVTHTSSGTSGRTDQVLSSVMSVRQPVHISSWLFSTDSSRMRVIAFCIIGAILLVSVLMAIWKVWWGETDLDQQISADARVDLAELVERGDGSWVHAYRASNADQKEGLELLFRCRIISPQEFLHGRVSQEHMDECVWISTQMLRQKPLEEWVAARQQALQSFEDSVTSVYAARTTAQFGKDSLQPKVEDSAPLQAALNDLLILKGGFHSPLVPSKFATPASVSPATPPFRIPASPFEQGKRIPADQLDDINYTFAPKVPEGPRLTFPQSGAAASGSRLHLSACLPSATGSGS